MFISQKCFKYYITIICSDFILIHFLFFLEFRTFLLQKAHIPCSFSYTKIRYDGVSEASKMYVGKNAETKFVTDITREAFQIREEYKDPKPMLPLTAQDQRRHDNATQCWVCKKEFSTQEVWISTLNGERYKAIYNGKVKDHCHITGKYRGPAHNDCNIQLQIKAGKMHILVIFHNLSGYDSHIIMKGIGQWNVRMILSRSHITWKNIWLSNSDHSGFSTACNL